MSASVRTNARIATAFVGTVLVASLIVWGVSRGPAPASASPTTQQQLLTFTGSGTAKIAPDTASVSAGISSHGASADAAQAAASHRMQSLIDHLKGTGVAESHMRTEDASVYEDWEHKGSYVASQSLTIDVDDPAKAGALLGEATAGGADTVSGPSFGLQDQRSGYAEALHQAIADARAKADAAAAQMDAKVTAVYSIGESSDGGEATPMYAMAGAAATNGAAVDVPVEQGTQDVSLTVQVSFTYER